LVLKLCYNAMMIRLQRNMRYRWLGGVCSGLARAIGFDVFPVRMLIRFVFVAFSPMLWWIYLILWVVLPQQRLYDAEDIALLGRSFAPTPEEPNRSVRQGQERLEYQQIPNLVRGKVSAAVLSKVEGIDAGARLLLPQLSGWRNLANPEVSRLRRAILDYFPQSLLHYLSLPRDYAEAQRLQDGQTSEEKLLADLTKLEASIQLMLTRFYHNKKPIFPDLKQPQAKALSLEESLEGLVKRLEGKVAPDIVERVSSIRASILLVWPQLAALNPGQDAYTVRQTALEYLPEALENYLSLPARFAETQLLSNGKTAKASLLEQLDLLDQTMKKMLVDVFQKDTDALLIHGRFLKEKFSSQGFALPSSDKADNLRMPTAYQQPQKLKL
jgi:phage shock protein PspC (stress-responsive transcriptional regulator)/regulator of sigma D